jgi:MoaA/NifB/PqqE/SkfB family radical SAM enzyme
MNLNKIYGQWNIPIGENSGKVLPQQPQRHCVYLKNCAGNKKKRRTREALEAKGTHIPPFIIASITSSCNLHCAGCYSQAIGSREENPLPELNAGEWRSIFNDASDSGISFILLAGGEPLTRRDIIETAAGFPNIVFPVFTNGTMIDDGYMKLFEKHRNIIPVFSIEGDMEETDARRGAGAYRAVEQVMSHFKKKKMLFGASVTVTTSNIGSVGSTCFAGKLRDMGCGVLFFVEYVPADRQTEHLALGAGGIRQMQKAVDGIRSDISDMITISFPGDEDEMGGCLASGRGFFHINAHGGAEPCPFSPFSQLNLKEYSIRDIVGSDFFIRLRKIAAEAEHDGGCTLFRHEPEVRALLARGEG